jgi:hypothetical protein
MASFDLYNLVAVQGGLNIGAITTNTTTNGLIVDTQGSYSVMWAIHSGTITDGVYNVQIREGDMANLSDGTLTSADFIIGDVADARFVAADDNAVKKIGYAGKKRYVRLEIVSTAVTSGGTLSASALLGHPRHAPAAV